MSDTHVVKEMLKEAQNNGFDVKVCKDGYRVHSHRNPRNIHTVHMSKRALHPLRRFLAKN